MANLISVFGNTVNYCAKKLSWGFKVSHCTMSGVRLDVGSWCGPGFQELGSNLGEQFGDDNILF